jgi:hypothetical protein
MSIDFNRRMTKKNIKIFTDYMKQLSIQIGFKVSSRGWCYIMEGKGFINKNQFNKVENWINRCRKQGYLPIDFTAEDSGRLFRGVESMRPPSYANHITQRLEWAHDIPGDYTPNWWEDEDFYIQMVVEKVDLMTLFEGLVSEYHIPIANARGWSSMLQRAKYARRFKIAESIGLKCVLLYFGDHDPDGLRIACNIRKNLYDLKDIVWRDGFGGYDPKKLKIERIGLTYAFIKKHKLTWIDNLITGGKKHGKPLDLASCSHRNHNLPYVQEYLDKYGARKCEANACVIIPEITQDYIRKKIEKYLGGDAAQRFVDKKEKAAGDIYGIMYENEVFSMIDESISRIRGEE